MTCDAHRRAAAVCVCGHPRYLHEIDAVSKKRHRCEVGCGVLPGCPCEDYREAQ